MTLPAVSAEFIQSLEAAFPPFKIEPGFDRDDAMQSAGEQKVIDWIKYRTVGRTVTGEPSELREVQPTGAIVKLGT